MKSIFVGEDSPVERRLLCAVLEAEQDYRVSVFEEGLALYRQVHLAPPDLLILDLLLPNLDGFMILRLLKFCDRFADLPILCVSSMRSEGLEQQLRALRADSFLPKPFDAEELLGRVRLLLSESRV